MCPGVRLGVHIFHHQVSNVIVIRVFSIQLMLTNEHLGVFWKFLEIFVDFSLLPIARVRGIYSVLKFGLLVSFPSTKYALIVNALFWVVSLQET